MKTETARLDMTRVRCLNAATELVKAMNPQSPPKKFPRNVNDWPRWAIHDWDLAFDALMKAARGE